MSGQAPVRLVVTVDRENRTFATIRERGNGDLIVTVQATGNSVRDLGLPGDEAGFSSDHGKLIIQQKISVHRSIKSADSNQMKLEQKFSDGSIKLIHHVTKAIASNKFAFLFSKRYSSLESENYHTKKDSIIHNIGVFQNKKFTMFSSFFVCSNDMKINIQCDDFDFYEINFEFFKIVVFYTYFLLVSNPSSMITYAETFKPEMALHPADRMFRESLMKGLGQDEVELSFRKQRIVAREEALATAAKMTPDLFRDGMLCIIARSRFFKKAIFKPKIIKSIKSRIPQYFN
jgi:hypothetical protein